MFNKILNYITKTIKEEYKFIILLILLYCIFTFPLNYYITIGGGASDVSSRIDVVDKDKVKSKGSFNISYVTQLEGTILTYVTSYIIPGWEREDANNYKYTKNESIEDIDFRGDLDLKVANENAKYWAYTLADKSVQQISSKLYVIAVTDEYKVPLKIQDQVLSIDDYSYPTVKEYVNYLQTKKAGDTVNVKVMRKNKEKVLECKLHKVKDKVILGVGLEYLTEYKTDPEVKIAFKKSESGPSGGLITTLEIYNQLTKEDLTKGKIITGTGTIEQDGTIGEIGGVEHKLLGAAKAKSDVFLVPSGDNYKEAIKYKKEKKLKVKVIEAKNIEQAIKKLGDLK